MGKVHQIFLVEGWYTPDDVLRRLREDIRRNCPDGWCSLDGLHRDSRPAHVALSVR